jgi:uncharacterized membrane protein YjjP (DUF1212 family)
MAVVVSAIARAVSSINSSQVFCYQAIASGGVVLILPGFLIRESCASNTPSSVNDGA